ncbi:MAG: MaoC family dehydratase N-terminal domain-containing protein [Candidatus Lokiarchaeota archaeon]|nr:MaoC family dehydratase N-terminal domain-containing protein [Candidatus Lokiarchaeota archaeon]
MQLTPEEEKLSEKFKIFIGKKIKKSIHRVKGKNLVQFAELLGNTNPKYVRITETADGKTDYSNIVAHPCYPNCFTVGDNGAAFDVINWRFPLKEGEEQAPKLIRNYGKLLHTSQEYDYSKAELPIQHGQKLYTTGFMEKAYIKAGKLWLVVHMDTHTEEGKLVVQSKVTTAIREGGY